MVGTDEDLESPLVPLDDFEELPEADFAESDLADLPESPLLESLLPASPLESLLAESLFDELSDEDPLAPSLAAGTALEPFRLSVR